MVEPYEMSADGTAYIAFHFIQCSTDLQNRHPEDYGCKVGTLRIFLTPDHSTSCFPSLISPFVLTRELLPVLRKTASHPESDVRIVVVRETPSSEQRCDLTKCLA